MEVLSRTGQRRLQDNVTERRLCMAGHIIRMPSGWPANNAMSWTPRGSGRRQSRPTKTWRFTFKEDLVDRGVDWNSVQAVATNRSRWRTLAAHCPVKDLSVKKSGKCLASSDPQKTHNFGNTKGTAWIHSGLLLTYLLPQIIRHLHIMASYVVLNISHWQEIY